MLARGVRELRRKGVPTHAIARYLKRDRVTFGHNVRRGHFSYALRCKVAWLLKAFDEGNLVCVIDHWLPTITTPRAYSDPEKVAGMPILTFRCGNTKCGVEYDTSKPEPRCPKCRSKKAQWVPVRLAIRKVASQVDRDVRTASEQYAMSDFRKPYRGESMRTPRAASPTGVTPGVHQIGGVEFPVPVFHDPSGNIVTDASRCEPCGVGPRIQPKFGARLSEDRRAATYTPRTVYEAATLQRKLPE